MKWSFSRFFLLLLFPAVLSAQNMAPKIQNLSASVDWMAQSLSIQYDVSDAENDPLEVTVFFSNDGGKTYSLSSQVPVSGAVGYPVIAGAGRMIQCDLSQVSSTGMAFRVRLIVDDRQPFDLQALVNEVDSTRLRSDLEFVEGIRHRTTGLDHLNAVRDSMERLFAAQNLYTELQAFAYGNYTGRNVLGTFVGSAAPDSVIIVDAHYDSFSNAPGADDNGSGTVGVWEIARLLSRYPAKKSLRYIGFDLEEAGLVGSVRYVSSGIPATEKIQGVFNFEMIGYYSEEPNSQELPAGFNLLFPVATATVAANQYRGDFITNVGNYEFPEISTLFQNSATTYVPDLKVISVSEPVGVPIPDLRRSDHTPFWTAHIPALMLTDGANFRNECYHTSSDTLDNKLSFTFMANVVKATLAATAQMAGIQHGDWATVDFDGTSSSQDLLQFCSISVGAMPGAGRIPGLFANDCSSTPLQVELFNTKGQLLHRETISTISKQEWVQLGGSELAPGIYFINIRATAGSHTFKVALF